MLRPTKAQVEIQGDEVSVKAYFQACDRPDQRARTRAGGAPRVPGASIPGRSSYALKVLWIMYSVYALSAQVY